MISSELLALVSLWNGASVALNVATVKGVSTSGAYNVFLLTTNNKEIVVLGYGPSVLDLQL